MRYKCVMPMIVEQEAQERERQRKKGEEEKEENEEEERSTVKVEGNIDAEIDESKKRIYEHFKHISQAANETTASAKKKKKSTNLVLGQMHGRKRKRESEIGCRETSDDSEFSVPTPSPDVQIARRSKKIKKETIVKQKIKQETLAQAPSASDTENIKSIR